MFESCTGPPQPCLRDGVGLPASPFRSPEGVQEIRPKENDLSTARGALELPLTQDGAVLHAQILRKGSPNMPLSRAVAVLGMHRTGTSVLARGLESLGVSLGDDFLDTKPDNPTGYWEDRNIVGFNERVLEVFGLKWESVAYIEDAQWEQPELEAIRADAVEYIREKFGACPLWGFKDPRTVRLLPFWASVFPLIKVEESYLVVIRNPLSVASSLLERQGMDAATSHSLWLLYMVPYLGRIANKPFVITDYDLFMAEPLRQLERITQTLDLPRAEETDARVEDFVANFIDPGLRHTQFGRHDFDLIPHLSLLVQKAYLALRQMAVEQSGSDRFRFWPEWEQIMSSTRDLFRVDVQTGVQEKPDR